MKSKPTISILILLLILIGLAYMRPFSKQPKILETRDFSCSGMTGFTFKYPVFEEANMVGVAPDEQNDCLISFNTEDIMSQVKEVSDASWVAQAKVTQISGKQEYRFGSEDNPRGLSNYINPQQIVYLPLPIKNPSSIQFKLSDDKHLKIEIVKVYDDSKFSKDLFFQTVIESFRVTK